MIVVTGGAGFIGSNLVAALEERGETDIVVCDRFGTGEKWRNLAKRELRALVPPEHLFDFLNAHATEIDTVFHLGAISATTERDVDLIIANNFALSVELWHWCVRSYTRFIYASSAATYGDGALGFDDDGGVEALARLRPLNPYGWSKHLFDRFVARAVRGRSRTPPQWAGLKFFNVYGPNEYHKGEQASVVSKLYPRIVSGEPARLFRSHRPDYEDGGQLRDFIWVGDCAEVMLWLRDNAQVHGLYNVGTGQARSFLALARATFAAAGLASQVDYIDMPEDIRDRYQYFTQAETGRLRAAGYSLPFTTLEDGVHRYVRQHLATTDPYL
jgi:ADP-L-glycero-D-manno-heptose 6-epimerase